MCTGTIRDLQGPDLTQSTMLAFIITLHKIKTYISNLVSTTRFWNNLHQVHSKSKDWNNLHQVSSKSKDWKAK
jgi:uncharacterized membrane protein